MEIKLNHDDLPTVFLTWDQNKSTLDGDAEIIRQIKKIAEYAIKDGYIAHVINGINFPVTDPLKNKDEFALVLAFLGYTSKQVPVPSLNNDHSEIVIY
ncbi:hypothetical protein [Acinetobacter haemolyticus]|uniref:hypothetical protein n=1 Tax=Acinetobacter haemolyticus TaxID=29430 RepID=UPI000F74B2A3|nr:hypothetical protein [Acinetobacter haemolyticus]RSN77905.1 hypothetical protein EA769_03540 [Acinetobacter haemolyticus]